MRRGRRRGAKRAVAAAVLACSLAAGPLPAGKAAAGAAADRQGPSAAAQAPPSLEDLEGRTVDGRHWRPGAVSGRVVLVDFWATWCAPCLAALPELRRLRQDHAGDGFEIVGVPVDSLSRRELRSWLARQDVDWPQIHDPRGLEGPVTRRFGVRSVPRSFLFDHRGRLVAVDLPLQALPAAVEALLEYAPAVERRGEP